MIVKKSKPRPRPQLGLTIEQTHALDKRALKVLSTCETLQQAYQQAWDERITIDQRGMTIAADFSTC